MKVFHIEYRYEASSPEESVVVAKDEATARTMGADDIVDLYEVDLTKEQVIYTGYSCC